ncbi:hypothetical protein JTE90_002546 [Oedothorax gibbosus]|uniref:Uncharacterized protein n=1 Tax=Oedothorax gibbosus TaxID=931172 RepID=A0AAV6V387_9ARAC|nr:hypothetical protein JTE90_002546 [Oedothorax gibbosus]
MEASHSQTDNPADNDSLNFAKSLFSSIWTKFKVVQGNGDPHECSEHYHVDISKAVLCEQMLTRSFYKCFLFVSKKAFILKDTKTAITFCKIMCERTEHWNYFKRILRFSALIAEFFLYRTQRMQRLQLQRAPLIWNTIFKKFFAETFCANNGWEGLLQYSQRYGDAYPPLGELIENMESPYESISVYYFDNTPRNMTMPETDPAEIDQEMTKVFRNFQSYFASKQKPKTPIEKHHEMDIPEGSEKESSSESLVSDSESNSSLSEEPNLKLSSVPMSQQAKKQSQIQTTSDDEDVTKKSEDSSESRLDRPSCSTSVDSPQDDLPFEELSKEVQTSGSDDSAPSFTDSDGKDSKKRPKSIDTSISDNPANIKYQKKSESP